MNIAKSTRRVSSALAVALLALTGAVALVVSGPAPGANAAEGINMDAACRYTASNTPYGSYGYKGYLTYPSQGALGWRCKWLGGADEANYPTMGVDLWGFCNYIGYGGAYTNNPSNAYSWYCA